MEPNVPATVPALNPPLPNRPAELLFQVGAVQCFWFPLEEDVLMDKMPHEVYWRDARYSHTFGPFPSMYNAMSHYAYLADGQKKGFVDMNQPNLEPDRPSCPVVMVDFKTRQKIKYDVPGGEDVQKR